MPKFVSFAQELRDACDEKGLDSTGTKAVLLDRLEAALTAGGAAEDAGGDAAAPPAEEEEELADIDEAGFAYLPVNASQEFISTIRAHASTAACIALRFLPTPLTVH